MTSTEIRCAGCGGEVDQLTDAAHPYCSNCQVPAEELGRKIRSAESRAMEHVADSMHEEADQLQAIDAANTLADDLRGWAGRLKLAAAVRPWGGGR